MKHKLQKKQETNQKGFTLIEIGIVLVIISVLVIGVLSFSTDTKTSAKANTEVSSLIVSTEKLSTYFEGDYSGLNAAVALTIVPDSMIRSGSLVNQFGQSITYAPVTINGVANGGFTLTTSYPQEACMEVVRSASDVFAIINVDGNDVKALNGNLDKSALSLNCSSGADVIDVVYSSF